MNEKKSASIKGLVFREFFLGRKSYVSILIMAVVVPFMFMLCMLSAKFGNLRLVEDSDEMIETIYIMSLYFPATEEKITAERIDIITENIVKQVIIPNFIPMNISALTGVENIYPFHFVLKSAETASRIP